MVTFACKNTQRTSSDSLEIQNIIKEQLGESFERVDQNELALCYTSDQKNMPNWKTVIVINKENGEILYGPEKINGAVEWYSDRELLFKGTPEVIEDKKAQPNFSYIYNLDTRTKGTKTPDTL
jgi:hypothetical protein